jgi:hypothetical protein
MYPAMPPSAYKSYVISAPLRTHWGPATCAAVDCGHYLGGWDSLIDERTELGQQQAWYIRKESGRRFTEERRPDGLTVFRFEAGQRCFQQHKARNMRPETYLERGGDWRGNPTGQRRVHARPDDWVESFALNQDRLRAIQERG